MSTQHHRVAFTVVPDQVEAAVRASLPEQARELVTRFLDRTGGTAQVGALAARSRALVDEEPDKWFQEALRLHAEADVPLDQARTALLYGEFLRRERRRREARGQLRAALETFDGLGASVWAERARGELRATGESVRKRDASAFDRLTPQELQVVRAVGRGITNREAAAQLFLSPRTVDDHLRKVFRKLGISSRTELVRLVLVEEDLDQH
jgi:DNA-binding NarL/FixJ family response regulator